MPGLFCGIDIGSTNLKVLLLDEAGKTRWVKSVGQARLHDGLGEVTDATALVERLEQLIIAGWREVGGGVPLAAIATTGIGEDGIGVGDGLTPLGPALAWFDKRAAADGEALATLPEAQAHPALRFDYFATACKWRWLRRERPEQLQHAHHWITLTDYPAVAWTGVPFISETLAARTACYDVFSRSWIKPLLMKCGAPPLPPVKTACEVIGVVRTPALLSAGAASTATLVVAGGHDHPVASSAIRRLDPLARVDSLGTANVTYGETDDPQPGTAGSGLDLSVPVMGGPGVSMTGTTEFSAALHAAVARDETILAVLGEPHLAGGPGPRDESDGARLRRAIEAATFRAKGFFAAMARFGVPEGPVYATGGWARSTALMELRASIFDAPIMVIDEPELTAVGAALFAAQAALGQAPGFALHHKLHNVEPRQDWAEAYRS